MGILLEEQIMVARGKAVYGTPQTELHLIPALFAVCQRSSDTCKKKKTNLLNVIIKLTG